MFTVLFNPFTAKAWITGNYVVSSSVLPMSSEAAWTTKALWTTPVSLCSTLCDHCWLSSDKRAWNPCLSSAGFLFLDRDFIDLDLVSGSGHGSGSGSCIWFHEEQQNWSMGTLNSCATGACFFYFSLFFFTKPLADSCRSHRVPHTEEVWSFASKGHNSVWRKVLRTEAGPTSINSFQHTLGNYLENKNSLCTAVGVGEGSTQVPIQNWRLADLDGLPDLFPSEKPPLWTGSRLALIRDGCCLLWLPPGAR